MNIGLFIYDTNYDPWPLNYEWKLIGLMLLKNSMLKTHALWCLQAFFYDMLWLWHLTSCSYNEKKTKKHTLYKLWLRLASKPMLYLFLWYHSAAFNFHLWPLKSTGFVHSLAPDQCTTFDWDRLQETYSIMPTSFLWQAAISTSDPENQQGPCFYHNQSLNKV